MKVTLNQEELTHAVVSYMVGKGYTIDDDSIEFQGDDYEILESLECEIQVIKEPNQ